MNTLTQHALGFLLLTIPCLAQEPQPPQPSPPSRRDIEDELKVTRLTIISMQEHVHALAEVVDEKEEAVRDAEDRLEKTKDSIIEYQNLLADHETNAGDPDLTSAQQREYARAIRATRAHLRKLDAFQVQEVKTLRGAEESLQRANIARQNDRDHLAKLRIQVERLLATLRSLPAGQ